MAGDHDDRQVGIGAVGGIAQHLGELDAIDRVHVEVNQGNIGRILAQHVERFGAVASFAHIADARALQNGPDDRTHMLIVLNQQDFQTTVIGHGL